MRIRSSVAALVATVSLTVHTACDYLDNTTRNAAIHFDGSVAVKADTSTTPTTPATDPVALSSESDDGAADSNVALTWLIFSGDLPQFQDQPPYDVVDDDPFWAIITIQDPSELVIDEEASPPSGDNSDMVLAQEPHLDVDLCPPDSMAVVSCRASASTVTRKGELDFEIHVVSNDD